MRELRVEDALLYLDQVKVEFGDRPHIYNEFLDIMKTFKTQQIDTPGVIRRVSNLFQGNRRLVLGFNTFLPEGYKIELPDGDGPPVAVFRAPGETITHILSGPPGQSTIVRHTEPVAGAAAPPSAVAAGGVAQKPGNQYSLQQNPDEFHMARGPPGLGGPQPPPGAIPPSAAAFAAQPGMLQAGGQLGQQQHLRGVGPPGAVRPPPQQAGRLGMVPPQPDGKIPARPTGQPAINNIAQNGQPPAGADGTQQQPLEFDHAINYVTTIKKRFADEPETYKKFLEILHTYQKEQRGIKEVLEEVSVLFSEHPDLLREFTYFLPDAVQSEAKAQLEVVVREAEERKRLKTAAAAAAATAASARTPAPAPARAPQRPTAPPAAPPKVEQRIPSQPLSSVPSTRIAFGATAPRSAEREKEIQRSSVYGKVTFGPSRPPRKNALTVSQAAQKNGRPTMLPPLPLQPTAAETAFFERAKRHLSRKELAPEKPQGRVRHTPYAEFLKCIHLFAAGILNKEELVLLLRGLFVQGHAPKSGANAGGGASNPSIANDAHDLLKEFEELLIGRGPYADQQSHQKDKSKYGAKRARDFEFRDPKKPTPSYIEYPKDYPVDLFLTHTGQTEVDSKVLNGTLICVGSAEKPPGIGSPEDYDAVRVRRNVYEEAMFRIEDERFEVDMAIERNALAMRQIEPIAEEVQMLREAEEKDGQPIGRLQYKLNSRTLNSIQINAIGRIYGDNGDEVIEHLARNPLAVLPIVYQRLRQKDHEWRKQKSELMPRWKSGCEANYEGSLDFPCYPKRRALERRFGLEQLREECKLAREYCSSPDKRFGAISFGLSVPDRSAILYEPYVVVEIKPRSSVHHNAVKLLMQHVEKKCEGRDESREKVGRIWTEFIIDFFDYPNFWVLDEARESFLGKINNFVVQCK
jgi:paired amphipathic helix protein Sin3a